MKKSISIIVLFFVLLISVSAYTGRVIDAKKGYSAPLFSVENANSTMSIDDARGKYLLLTFWSSSDADSRIRCNEYTDFAAKQNENEQLCLLSVNFDRSERLFREIVRRDNLNAESQFYVQGTKAAQLRSDYHLEDGYQSFLIDPQGRIVAENPSTTLLTQLLSH